MPEGDTIHHAARARRRRAGRAGTSRRSRPRTRAPARSLARAAGRPRRAVGGRPRQTPVHPLRGRPDAALAPAHDRQVGRLPPRRALAPRAPPGVAGHPHRRARGRAVRRPGAGADHRLAHPLRPPPGRPWPRRAGAGVRRAQVPRRACARTTRTRGIGDALLDQRNLAGIGNIWKAESCFLAGLDPWKPVAEVGDEEAAAAGADRPPADGRVRRARLAPGDAAWVYERAGRPCRRCGTLVRARGQGDDNRTTFWCPGCQR